MSGSLLDGIDTSQYAGRQAAMREACEREENRRIRKDKRDGRLIGAVLVVTCLLIPSVVGNIVQGMLGIRVEPYVILMDHLGNERPMIKVAEMTATPEESMIMGVLTNWIEDVRRISSDAKMMNDNWDRAEQYTSQVLLEQLTEYRAQQKIRQQTGMRVQITTPIVMPIRGTRSYHLEWREETIDPNGALVVKESGYWTAKATVGEFHTKAAKEMRALRLQRQEYRNLMGIIVDDVYWTHRPL